MKCPFCRETDTEVFNTRSTRSGNQIWRRRRCMACGQSFTSYEQADLKFLKVFDANGKAHPYTRSQLFAEIYNCFVGVTATPETIDAVTDTVEAKLLDLRQDSVMSSQISEIVLVTLKHFNTPAFLRYLANHAKLSSKTELKRQLKKY